MIFNDEDVLLGYKKHNKHLFMFGDIDDLHINRIMVDGGSAINLLPLCTLKKIGYSQRDLSLSNVVIHSFNHAVTSLLKCPSHICIWVFSNQILYRGYIFSTHNRLSNLNI
jgi:hypothetical protein